MHVNEGVEQQTAHGGMGQHLVEPVDGDDKRRRQPR